MQHEAGATDLGALSLGAGVRRTVLPNGMTVLTKEIHTYPIVASVVWYRVGARNEELGQTGKSHFLEHMLFKGTDRFPKGAIDMTTLTNGGSNNAFTWLDYTAYYFTFASDRWEVALEIEADRMRNVLFDADEFASEKKVVIEELQIGLDGPWEELEHELYATAFRQHPYHNPTVGWLPDLLDATVDDMKAYYDLWYHPRNATLVLVGDFDTERTLARVGELFGPIPAGPEPPAMRIVEPRQRGEKRLRLRKPTSVERLIVGYHAPEVGHEDSYALQVVESALSTGRTSRFYKRLIEGDRSATVANASYSDHIDPCLFTIRAEVKPGRTLEEVATAIFEEIDRIREEGISAEELARIKRRIRADLILSNEQILNQAILLGEYETVFQSGGTGERRGYRYLDDYITRIEAVSGEAVRDAVVKYLTHDNRTVGVLVSDGSVEASEGAGEEPDAEVAAREPGGARPARSGAGAESPSRHASERPAEECWPPRPGSAARHRSRSSRRDDDEGAMEDEIAPGEIGPVPGALARPHVGGSVQPSAIDVERVTLPNGMTVLLAPNDGVPGFCLNVVVGAGARYESDEDSGLASFVGGMLDEGTERRSSQQLAEEIEDVGGHLATYGGYAQSGLRVVALSEDLDLGLELAADVLRRPTFPEDRVRMNVERRLGLLKSRADQPRVTASETFDEIVFAGHPNHRPIIGYEASVGRITRDRIAEFHRAYFRPDTAILGLAGNFDLGAARAAVERYFGDWASEGVPDFPAIPELARQTEPVERRVRADKAQAHLFLGHLGIRRSDPDYYALLVMDTILGSSPGFTSRIPRVLRDEQGLAYSTFSNIAGSAGIDPGRFVAYIGTSPGNVEQAIDGLRREIARIVEEPVTADELAAAKSYLTGSFVFHFQTNTQVAGYLINAEVFGLGFDYLERYPGLVDAVTVEDVQRAARAHLDPAAMTLVVVGPDA